MKLQATIVSRIVKVEAPDGPPYVIVCFAIDCPECGLVEIQLLGHHVRTIRDVCVEACDLYPELTTPTVETVETLKWAARANDPTNG